MPTKNAVLGLRDGSAANRALPALPKDQLISSQHSCQADPQALVTAAPGDHTLSSGLHGHPIILFKIIFKETVVFLTHLQNYTNFNFGKGTKP